MIIIFQSETWYQLPRARISSSPHDRSLHFGLPLPIETELVPLGVTACQPNHAWEVTIAPEPQQGFRQWNCENYEKVWIDVWNRLWISMKKYEKVRNEFFGRKLWIELFHESEFGDRYELMYEMILWMFCSKFGAHTFSYFFILFQFYTFYEKVWRSMKKYEKQIFEDHIRTNQSFIDLFCCVSE
jgi:hypothetical protein